MEGDPRPPACKVTSLARPLLLRVNISRQTDLADIHQPWPDTSPSNIHKIVNIYFF